MTRDDRACWSCREVRTNVRSGRGPCRPVRPPTCWQLRVTSTRTGRPGQDVDRDRPAARTVRRAPAQRSRYTGAPGSARLALLVPLVAFVLTQSAPHPIRLLYRQCVGTAFVEDRASAAYLFGLLGTLPPLVAALAVWVEELVGVHAPAGAVGLPHPAMGDRSGQWLFMHVRGTPEYSCPVESRAVPTLQHLVRCG